MLCRLLRLCRVFKILNHFLYFALKPSANAGIKMFRISVLKCVTQKQFAKNITLLQRSVKVNNAFECRCISKANLAQNTENWKKRDKFTSQTPFEVKKKFTDRQYLVRLKNDPDSFGPPQEEEVIDEGDIAEEKYFTEQPLPSQKLRSRQYGDMIKALIRQRKIKEAIDVLEVRMLKEDRVKPESYHYNLLLGACGRVGYTKKAFSLFNNMKKRGLKPIAGTYTALFNACANSPWPTTDGLERATHLRELMIEKGEEPNGTTYHAMIKAFGRCGDLSTAFALTDEMISKRIRIGNSTINFLLQACISDEEAGFRHALLVWRKSIEKKIHPNLYTYNLMLRCIRDCGMGDTEVVQDVVNRIVAGAGDKKLLDGSVKIGNTDMKLLEGGGTNEVETIETAVQATSKEVVVDQRPNLMAPVPHLGSLISISEIKKPEERLLLVGGFSGFLDDMNRNRCKPDIKTFTQLLDNIPGTLAAEKELLSAMKKFDIQPDIDFYNMLIKKRSLRHDYESAREVLKYMAEREYRPNLVTYGVLALTCTNKAEALDLLNEMQAKSYRLSIEILGAMLCQACYHLSFNYVLELMEICVREKINPSKKFMSTLEEFIKKKCRRLLNSNELTKSQEIGFKNLKARYKTWIQEVEVDDAENAHPWQQFQEKNEQDTKYYKWKDGARFKPRHASFFRVKTSRKHLKKNKK